MKKNALQHYQSFKFYYCRSPVLLRTWQIVAYSQAMVTLLVPKFSWMYQNKSFRDALPLSPLCQIFLHSQQASNLRRSCSTERLTPFFKVSNTSPVTFYPLISNSEFCSPTDSHVLSLLTILHPWQRRIRAYMSISNCLIVSIVIHAKISLVQWQSPSSYDSAQQKSSTVSTKQTIGPKKIKQRVSACSLQIASHASTFFINLCFVVQYSFNLQTGLSLPIPLQLTYSKIVLILLLYTNIQCHLFYFKWLYGVIPSFCNN